MNSEQSQNTAAADEVEPQGADAASGTTLPPPAKSIILFSDGTGNSSATLFKTNVWRMYEAVDLGPPTPGKRKQIAFYDNGVGTSGFKPLAVLGGVFGFGLKRNVLDIYRYACRNYEPAPGQRHGELGHEDGDHIYAFGFSRGGFTIRTAIAMIAKVGLVGSKDEAELDRRSKEAWRAYRAGCAPRSPFALANLWRWLFRRRRDRNDRTLVERERAANYHPVIRFVGVWDTVAAYGGPIIEITRGIDNWIYPLSMPNYVLSPQVRCARHALAIDDERDAFHPLLWDEVEERRMIASGEVAEGRLQQVWFTGMHADVGGGYPDESLSYVSFLWMSSEAEKAELRTLKVITERYRALASSAGPLHDSRAGPAVYYRYQPRNIGAWVHPADTASIVTDPELKDEHGRPKGLLGTVLVHESVLARIDSGTDRYAPFGLPGKFRIVPPHAGGETALQADSDTPEVPPVEQQPAHPMLTPDLRARLEDEAIGEARAKAMAAVWDQVWIRRITYFVTLFLTFALLLMPWWIDYAPDPPLLADGRTWIGGFIRLIAVVTPDFLDTLIDTMADNAFYFLLLVGAIGLLIWRTAARERRLRDLSRAIWQQTLAVGAAAPAEPRAHWVRGLRTSKAWRRPMRLLKWRVLPWLAAVAILAFLLWLVAGAIAQTWLPFLERGDALCDYRSAPAEHGLARTDFSPASTCRPIGLTVARQQRYIVEIEVVEPWHDAGQDADPAGLDAGELGFDGYLGVPFRRVVTANYLQPMIEIRTTDRSGEWDGGVHIQALDLERRGDSAASWRGEFIARRDGALALFVNEAVLPWDPRRLYGNNGGSACVTIRRADRAGELAPLGAPGTACAAADERAEAAQERRRAQEEARRREAAERKRANNPPPPAG